jgi:prepilin-type N-terminal cleavage/methylation domain-containing protein
MTIMKRESGFTILEMISAVAIIVVLSVLYLFLMDSYGERRMSEQAAKVLMLAAKAQEDYFAREHRYFDAELTGSGNDLYLSTPDGTKTSVRIPAKIVLSIKTKEKNKPGFTGVAFYVGSKTIHKYDSESGKIMTSSRPQENAG